LNSPDIGDGNQHVLSFYLPQFHRIKENSEWWGDGFTEWTNVAGAVPVFDGHIQPKLPADLGFYDLSNSDIMHEQTDLARQYGINGFVFYFYSFNGRRVLEAPLENFLETELDFPFSLCWANENWTRTWDGSEKEVLLPQNYETGFENILYSQFKPFFKDPRYIKFNNRPVLVIYRTQDIPNPVQALNNLRDLAKADGFPDLYILAVASFGLATPLEVGADGLVEFPPHGTGSSVMRKHPRGTSKKFEGHFFDLPSVALTSVAVETKPFDFYRGIMPSWDNTARRQWTGNIFLNESPRLFELWLRYLRSWTNKRSKVTGQANVIFVNAWNEWAEGAVLEPSLAHGRKYLEAVKSSIQGAADSFFDRTKLELIDFATGAAAQSLSRNRGPTWLRMLALVNMSSVKSAWRLLKEDPSGALLKASLKSVAGNLSESNVPQLHDVLKEPTHSGDFSAKVLLVCHLYYPEFLVGLVDAIKANVTIGFVFVTCTSREVYEEANRVLASAGISFEVKLVENRGRNFPSIFVHARSLIESGEFAFVSHLHSKRSVHSSGNLGGTWSGRLWSFGLNDESLTVRALNALAAKTDRALAFVDVSDLIKPWNMTWGASASAAAVLASKIKLNGFEVGATDEPIDFPAGGMFIARTEYLKELLSLDLRQEDFPMESGKTDGELQHAIERLIGVYASKSGRKMLRYSFETDQFSIIDSTTR
jgi:lipopolysaccharide biosynthesis protein